MAKPINQNGPQGDYEPRVLAKVPPPVKMGNDIAFTAGTGVGVGYVNHGSIVKQTGQSAQGYRNPALDDLDRYYGYSKEQGR